MLNELWPLAIAAICAAGLMPVVIRARAFGHDRRSSPQHVHAHPTSRLGGAIVFLAFVAGLVMAVWRGDAPMQPTAILLACALPVLLAGLWEDLSHRLSPRQRLVAAAISGVLASAFAGGIIARLDLPLVDGWLAYPLFAIPLTCFMVMGASNAFNLVDGAHGLLAGTALMLFAGLAGAAAYVGDDMVFLHAVAMVGALAGFLLWNFPRGRVFMGDGGAYFIGFIYAEMAIQLVARNAGISAWFVIMLAAYPIVETLYSIYRRKILHRTPSTQPDAMHLHSLVYRRLSRPIEHGVRALPPHRANAAVAPRLWVHAGLCCLLALVFHRNTMALIACLLAYAAFYHWQYRAFAARSLQRPFQALSPLQERSDANAD